MRKDMNKSSSMKEIENTSISEGIGGEGLY